MENTTLEIGTRIWNNGDMANASHFGTVTGMRGDHYEITADNGDEIGRGKPYYIPACMVSPEFKGHGGTRIVTEAAYRAFYESQRAAFLLSVGM